MRTPRLNNEMASHKPMRILVAEDNQISRRLITLMLQHMGYCVEQVTTGREAVTELRRSGYDVVLMDIDMPEMDGLEVTSLVREELSRREQPQIVAVTANVRAGDRERCITAGMNDYVSKPISAYSLSFALEGCYERLND